jgi:hypothetical protein
MISKGENIIYSSSRNQSRVLSIYEVNLSLIVDDFITHAIVSRTERYKDDETLVGKQRYERLKPLFESIAPTDIEFYHHIRTSANTESLLNYSKNEIFNTVPIITEISESVDCSTKQGTINYLLSKYNCSDPFNHKTLLYNYKRIIDDFTQSKYDSFINYYSAWERQALSFKDLPFKTNSINTYSLLSIGDYLLYYIPELKKSKMVDSFTDDNNAENAMNEIYQKSYINFPLLYETLLGIYIINNKDSINNISLVHIGQKYFFRPPDLYHCLNDYLVQIRYECLIPPFLSLIKYVDSSSINIQRVYTLNEGNSAFDLLLLNYNRILRNYPKRNKANKNYKPNTYLNKWLKEFGIGSSLCIKNSKEGLGILIYIRKHNKLKLLADEGHGISQILSIMLNIESFFLDPDNGKKRQPTTIIIEEPEIHLHPALQSKLADMFFDAYKLSKHKLHFLIETHSEYLIRETQYIVSSMFMNDKDCKQSENNMEIDSIDIPFRTYYVPSNHCEKPYSLGYRKDGKFAEDFGSGFFDEAARIAFKIL